MTIPPEQLSRFPADKRDALIGVLSGTDALTVVNLKGDPLLIGMLHSRPGFFPAYHMNKEHWISAALDGSVDAEELHALLAESFARTAPKKRAPRTKGPAPAKPGGGAG